MEIKPFIKDLQNIDFELKAFCEDFDFNSFDLVLNDGRAEIHFINANDELIGSMTSTTFKVSKEREFLKNLLVCKVRMEIIQELLKHIDDIVFKGGE